MIEKTNYSASYLIERDNKKTMLVVTENDVLITQDGWAPGIRMSVEDFERLAKKFYEVKTKVKELK